ncbi:hypothetical protein [Pseudonocardia sp. HH130630-07]|uniref:hypothetical protein n=1 Tax=Pseudonocardia sp. HH130630-07 TaxID=1690815 RepID=UPI000814D6FA|nr:hypothetical protein [Pseudonocardia sp. HH130630-07]ANY04999.1 hypothetical protein AFB00_00135 [Pseudonocardia sp. HH130630-07]
MTATQTGLIAGLLLGVAGAAGNFLGFVIALVLGVIGLAAGRYLDGDLDLSGLLGRGRDR